MFTFFDDQSIVLGGIWLRNVFSYAPVSRFLIKRIISIVASFEYHSKMTKSASLVCLLIVTIAIFGFMRSNAVDALPGDKIGKKCQIEIQVNINDDFLNYFFTMSEYFIGDENFGWRLHKIRREH